MQTLRFTFLVLLSAILNPSYAEETTLLVKAVKYINTPYEYDCGEGCITFDSWHVYTVKVKEVLDGEFDEKKINVAVVEHGQRHLWSRKNWKIVVEEFNDKRNIEKFGAKYLVVKQPR